MIKINVHPNPINKNHDYCLPYAAGPRKTEADDIKLKKSSRISKHTPEVFADHVKEIIKSSTAVVLTNNGEPPPRMDAARLAIEKYLPNVKVTYDPPINNMYKNSDNIFLGKEHRVLKDVVDKKLANEIIDYYLKIFDNMAYNPKQMGDRYHGYFPYGDMLWYQYGKDMPNEIDQHHASLNKNLKILWKDLLRFFKDFFEKNNMPIDRIEDKLVIRLVHNVGKEQGQTNNFFKHLDNSLITGWLTQRPAGAKIFFYKTEKKSEKETEAVDIETLFDKDSNDIIIIPGTAWCDRFMNNTPATWHEVSHLKNFKGHRTGLVVMIRDHEFEKTKYEI